MFGKDEQREHEKIINNIEAKKMLVTELIRKSDLSKTVFLKNMVLKLDFIIEIHECPVDSERSAYIKYFDFDFDKQYCISTTKTIWIEKSDMSFDELLQAIKSAT